MRRALGLAFAASLAIAGCADGRPPPVASPVAHPDPGPIPCVTIVAWNDMHGQLGPDSPVLDTGRVPAGGVVAVADEVELARIEGHAVVALDAGDLFTGPLASTFAEGAPIIEAYNLIGVDAAAIGNHDFDFGPAGNDLVTAPEGTGDEAGLKGPRGALLARMSEARFPFLSANVRKKKGNEAPGWPRHKGAVTIVRGRVRVGVVGYTTQETPATTLKPNVADLDFETSAAANVAREIRALRSEGASPIVLLAHASLEGPLPNMLDDDAPRSGEIDALVRDLEGSKPDIIIAGHRHAWMVGRVRGVPIVSSDHHGVGVAKIRYCKSTEGAALTLEGIERRVAFAYSKPRTALGLRVKEAMDQWIARVAPIAQADVATIPRECAPKAPSGTRMADQVAEATRARIGVAAAPPAGVPVVGLTNIGSLRAPLAAGKVKFEDVFTVAPFENTVASCVTTRRGLVRLIENALAKDSSRERFPLGIAGVSVRIKRAPSGKPSLVALAIEGEQKPLRDDAPVAIALSDFVLLGGDDLMDGVACSSKATSQARIRDVWRAQLERERACDGPSKNVIVE